MAVVWTAINPLNVPHQQTLLPETETLKSSWTNSTNWYCLSVPHMNRHFRVRCRETFYQIGSFFSLVKIQQNWPKVYPFKSLTCAHSYRKLLETASLTGQRAEAEPSLPPQCHRVEHQNPKQGDAALFLMCTMSLLGNRARRHRTGSNYTGQAEDFGAIRENHQKPGVLSPNPLLLKQILIKVLFQALVKWLVLL